MIKRVEIEDFKCLHQEILEFKPLTIITGLNSTGKSSLIQAILLPQLYFGGIKSSLLIHVITSNFESLRNKYYNAKSVGVSLTIDSNKFSFFKNQEINFGTALSLDEIKKYQLKFEENLFYLSANRIGIEQYSRINTDYKVGTNGEYLWGTFENEKSVPVIAELVKDENSSTLSAQVNYWLSKVLEINTELQSEKRLDETVEIRYHSDGLQNIPPLQLGAGVGYLTKILIMCLRAKKGDILIIENPEIHLHPASQAKVGEFLAFIANAGIQVIIETHCEHLIYKVGYEIYKKRFSFDKAVIFYKGGIQKPFEEIRFKEDGKFVNDFPDGFFDATLAELLEME